VLCLGLLTACGSNQHSVSDAVSDKSFDASSDSPIIVVDSMQQLDTVDTSGVDASVPVPDSVDTASFPDSSRHSTVLSGICLGRVSSGNSSYSQTVSRIGVGRTDAWQRKSNGEIRVSTSA